MPLRARQRVNGAPAKHSYWPNAIKKKVEVIVAKKFPDVSGDGEVTKKDVLMAKGVIPAKKGMKSGY